MLECTSGIKRRLASAGAFAILGAAGFSFYPVDSDASFAVFDGMYYAVHQKAGTHLPEMGHHPLFHAAASAVGAMLWWVPMEVRAHAAHRIMSTCGLGALVVLIVGAAGPYYWKYGFLPALIAVAARGVFIDGVIGESIVPGAAIALWTLQYVASGRATPLRVTVGIVASCLIRADNVSIVPGIVVMLLAAEWSLRRTITVVVWAGMATVGLYILLWLTTLAGELSFWKYLTFSGTREQWGTAVSWDSFVAHCEALSAVLVGREGAVNRYWAGIVVAWSAATIGLGLLFNGGAPANRMAIGATIVILTRSALFGWFDVHNWEWWVLPVSTVCAWVAARASGGVRLGTRGKTVAVCLTAAISAGMLLTHGSDTVSLRRRDFVEAIRELVRIGDGCHFIADGPVVSLALDYLDVPHTVVADERDPRDTVIAIGRQISAHPGPAMIIIDRWLLASDPAVREQRRKYMWIDTLESQKGLIVIKREGRTVGLRMDP